jgi:Fe2+ or Zn2+ uptake regulation protein
MGIFTILIVKDAFEIENGIRSNQLLKLVKHFIDPKTAAPTLYRHLRHLTKTKIIKKTRKGKQYIVYSLPPDSPLITKEDLELSKKWHDFHTQQFSSWTLERIILNELQLSKLLELETLKLWLQRQLPEQNAEGIVLRSQFVRAFYKQYGDLLLDAAKGRTPLEYKEAMESLEKEIAILKKGLFEIKRVASE